VTGILCLDSGNTRIKWGLRQDDVWLDRGAMPVDGLAAFAPNTDRVVACNVAGAAAQAAIKSLAARLDARLEWVESQARQCGVINGYEQPQQLGADRWAALIGARGLHGGTCLVVNAGTATTVDVLGADGRFRGGLILPGVTMMRQSLASNTAQLPVADGNFRALPTNTADAIASGALAATLGAIERMFAPLAAEPEVLCLLSGGAASALLPHLRIAHRLIPDLVLEGLAAIAG
jgi:type III pantothenate kinase